MKLMRERPERLADRLYGQILDQIVSGSLKTGDKLPSEHQICRSFDVSRPTVREALMRLQADGLVVTRQGSGTYVQRRPSESLTQVAKVSDVAGLLRGLEVRFALESQAAMLAAARRTTVQMDRITRALVTLRSDMQDSGIPARTDFEFHLAVAEASGNELFPELLTSMNEVIQQAMTVALSLTRAGSKDRARRVIEEHEAIVEAIQRADSEGAELAMRYHLHRSRQRVTDRQRDE